MAQKVRLMRGSPITLQENESGLDVFLRQISKYADPEYQLRKNESDARIRYQEQQAQRENAKIEIAENEAVQNKEWTDLQIETKTAEEARAKSTFEEQKRKDAEAEAINDWNIVYPESSHSTEEGIAVARGWLDNNPEIDPQTYNTLRTRLDQDESILTKSNNMTDNLGKELDIMTGGKLNYDGSESKRQLVKMQGQFMLKNAISQKYLGEMPASIQATYKQDMTDLSKLIKLGFEGSASEADRNAFMSNVLGPAYTSLREEYAQYDVSSPAIEGLLSNAGYNFSIEKDDIDVSGIEKIDDDEVMKEPDIGLFSFITDPKGTEEVVKSKPGQAKLLRDELSKLNKLQSNRPVMMAGEPIPSTKKEAKYQEQRSKLMNAIAGKYDPNTQRFTDANFEKAFNRLAGDNKELYYSLLQDMFPVGSRAVRNLDIDDPKAYEGGEDISTIELLKRQGIEPSDYYTRLKGFPNNPFTPR